MAIFSMSSWIASRTHEISRLKVAEKVLPEIVNRYQDLVDDLREELGSLKTVRAIPEYGRRLWSRSVEDVRSGYLDDRCLYWTRLKMVSMIIEHGADELVQEFEYLSRGMQFSNPTRLDRVVLTGFDPFHLDQTISQSNPSGLIALAMNGQYSPELSIQTAIFPVRFLDFEQDAIVENYLSDVVSPSTKLVITCSMGRDQFDIERFVIGRRTSSAPDNCNLIRSDEPVKVEDSVYEDRPTEPNFHEFLESSLPPTPFAEASRFGPWNTKFNAEVETVERGVFEASTLEDLQNQTAKVGSGGGFLSNEISYRSLLWQKRRGASFPMGHIHVPKMEGYDPVLLAKILEQFRLIFLAIAQELN